MLVAAVAQSDCEYSCGSSGSYVPGTAFLFAATVLAAYDVVKAPQSARRANERHGLVDVGVVPTVTTGGITSSRGLALGGRF